MSPGIVGEGAGYELPKFKKAPWYPESYYPFRGYNFTTRKTIEEHPKLVKAFIMATEQAVRELKKMTNEDISQIVRKYWKLPPKQGTIVVADSLPLLRGWSWMTESDARSIVEVSKFMAETGALPKPLTMKEVKENVEVVAPIMKEAYGEMGGTPDVGTLPIKTRSIAAGFPCGWRASGVRSDT